MKKSTDLNSVKEVAGCLLYTDVHKVENYPFLVKHPFTDSAFAAIAKNPEKVTENKVINILESENNLNRWREYVAERIDSADSAYEIYSRITKPYRLTFMKYAGQYLSEKDFAEMLCSAWITSENPNSDANVTQIPVGIILYEMKKGLNKRFFQKKHEKHLIFLSEYGIIRLYFIR